MPEFTSESLPQAIASLFRLNNYDVVGPVEVHGAEIDLVATPFGDPFGVPVYIEATLEHVDNQKYGKDVGKLALIGELDRDARRLIVSSKGFSLPVRERAAATRIETLTYLELFARFERFERYIATLLDGGELASRLAALDAVYEEPLFEDATGTDPATTFLNIWRASGSAQPKLADNRWRVRHWEDCTDARAPAPVGKRPPS